MPYQRITQLPKSVKNVLPKEAQQIFKKVFNNAWDQYDDEEICFKVAWKAVKRKYKKGKIKWVLK